VRGPENTPIRVTHRAPSCSSSPRCAAWAGGRSGNRIALAIRAAAHEPGGIPAGRGAIAERAAVAYQDWMSALAALADVDARMVAVLGELDLARLVTAIPA
jgi:hypothetical protein